MGYEAKVLADSISPAGVRLITVQATFPRFILAEVNTHRVFSRNSASSRAIPPDDVIDPETGEVKKKGLISKVKEDPFVPETFNSRVKGMGVGDQLDEDTAQKARWAWMDSLDQAVMSANDLVQLGVDKSRINRLLEPFMWHTAIISSTEWDNFFALRCPPGNEATIEFPAQLEFQKVAILMREAMKESKPRYVDYGNWHLPMVGDEEKSDSPAIGADWEFDELVWPRISAGRCAKVSFDTHENYETPTESYVRQTHRLESNGHLSPAEHPATPACPDDDPGPEDFCGNFRGWVQLRKQIPDEDNLVGALEGRENWMDEG